MQSEVRNLFFLKALLEVMRKSLPPPKPEHWNVVDVFLILWAEINKSIMQEGNQEELKCCQFLTVVTYIKLHAIT